MPSLMDRPANAGAFLLCRQSICGIATQPAPRLRDSPFGSSEELGMTDDKKTIACSNCARVLITFGERKMTMRADVNIRMIDRAANQGTIQCPSCRTETPVDLSIFKGFYPRSLPH
jgi:hypothetical protein